VTVAVVTGAGGSLGRAIARRLAADGHLVAVTDVDGPGLDELAAVVSFLAGPGCLERVRPDDRSQR
jgi:NAD(P)-dependent dehydrogenase (short-subunit alcohol dehydrogenase family)